MKRQTLETISRTGPALTSILCPLVSMLYLIIVTYHLLTNITLLNYFTILSLSTYTIYQSQQAKHYSLLSAYLTLNCIMTVKSRQKYIYHNLISLIMCLSSHTHFCINHLTNTLTSISNITLGTLSNMISLTLATTTQPIPQSRRNNYRKCKYSCKRYNNLHTHKTTHTLSDYYWPNYNYATAVIRAPLSILNIIALCSLVTNICCRLTSLLPMCLMTTGTLASHATQTNLHTISAMWIRGTTTALTTYYKLVISHNWLTSAAKSSIRRSSGTLTNATLFVHYPTQDSTNTNLVISNMTPVVTPPNMAVETGGASRLLQGSLSQWSQLTLLTYASITTIHTTLLSSFNRITLLTKATRSHTLFQHPTCHPLFTTLITLAAITVLAITNQLCCMTDLSCWPRDLYSLGPTPSLPAEAIIPAIMNNLVTNLISQELAGSLLTTVMMAALYQTIYITSKTHKPHSYMPRYLPNVLHYYCILCAHIWCGYSTIRSPFHHQQFNYLHKTCRRMYPQTHALYHSPLYAIQNTRMNHSKYMMTMGMKGGARTAEQVSSPHPSPLNQTTLPIPQLPGFLLTVADSTLPGAGQGLFTLKRIEVDDYLCTYEGRRLSREDLPRPLGPENDYIWSNSVGSTIIDAFHYLSCFGRYANDALHEDQCNAMIVMHNGKVKLRATRDILPNEEIFVHYGGGYWADRFHTLGDSSSVATLSIITEIYHGGILSHSSIEWQGDTAD